MVINDRKGKKIVNFRVILTNAIVKEGARAF